uniref:Uncharacterized protein n=1 Tax=Myoviridae sp. ct5xZ3 TaxID=2827601 RepID=A0A8S5RRX3_9CAUD|nr:MAG TPA: hypothetical protein [Myoviridae sp. ct5xZ3]
MGLRKSIKADQRAADSIMELLTQDVAKEYQRRVEQLPDNGLQDIGERRSLRLELQEKYGLTELQAINVLNNRHVGDCITIQARRAWQNANSGDKRI